MEEAATDNSYKESVREETQLSTGNYLHSIFQSSCYKKDEVTVNEEEARFFNEDPTHLHPENDDSRSSNSNSNVLIINLDDEADSGFETPSLAHEIIDSATDVTGVFPTGQLEGGAKEVSMHEESSSGGSTLSPFAETFGGSVNSWRSVPPLTPLHCQSFQDPEPPCHSASTWWSPETLSAGSIGDGLLRNVNDEARNRDTACCGHAYDHSRTYSGYGGGTFLDPYYYPSWSSVASNGCLSSFDGLPDDRLYPLDNVVNSTRNWPPPPPDYSNHLTSYSDTALRNVNSSVVQETGPQYWTEHSTQYQSDLHDDSIDSGQHRISSLHTPPPLLDIGSPQHSQPNINEEFEDASDSNSANEFVLSGPEKMCNGKEPVDLRVGRTTLQPLSSAETIPSISYQAASIIPSANEDQNKLLTYFMVYPVNGTNATQPCLVKPSFAQPPQVRRVPPPRYITVREMLAERNRTERNVNTSKRDCSPLSQTVQNQQIVKSTTTSSSVPSDSSSALSLSAQFPITSALLREPKNSSGSTAINNIVLYPLKSLSSQFSSVHSAPNVSYNTTVDSSTQLGSSPSVQRTALDVSLSTTGSSPHKKLRRTTAEDKSSSAVTSTAPHLIWKQGHLLKSSRHGRSSVRKPLHFDVQHLFIGKFKVEVFATKRFKLLNRLKVLFSKRLFIYEFDVPDNVGDTNKTQSKVAAIQFPFSTIEAIHCNSRLVQVKVKQAPEMFLGCRKLQCHTGGGNIQYNRSENVDLTGGELARYPLHELLLRKEEAERLQTSLAEFDSSFKKKITTVITVDCQEPEPKSLTHVMIEQPTVDIVNDSGQQWKRFCFDLEQANSERSLIEQSFMSIS